MTCTCSAGSKVTSTVCSIAEPPTPGGPRQSTLRCDIQYVSMHTRPAR